MASVIYTGDDTKCIQLNYYECPACGDRFEILDGTYVLSSTLDDHLLVCKKHTEFSATDEIKIQESLQKALNHKRGRVQKDLKLLKRCELLEKIGYQIKKDW